VRLRPDADGNGPLVAPQPLSRLYGDSLPITFSCLNDTGHSCAGISLTWTSPPCPSETRCLSKSRRHFDGFRRGGFFAPSDLMMRLPFPLDGNGTLA